MNCENCKAAKAAATEKIDDHESPALVPLYAVEGDSFRKNKTVRMLAVMFVVSLIIIAVIVGFFGFMSYRMNRDYIEKVEAINQHWLDYLSEYDFSSESYEYSQDGRGLNIMGDNNGVEIGEEIDDGSEAENNSEAENEKER